MLHWIPWRSVLAVGALLAYGELAAAEAPTAAIKMVISGNDIVLKAAGATRGNVLQHVLGASGVDIDWLDAPLAEEPVTGRFLGSIEEIVGAVLDHFNFVIAYQSDGQKLRMVRVVIAGRCSPSGGAPKTLSAGRPAGSAPKSSGPAAEARRRVKHMREEMLSRMHATEAAIKKRLSNLPPGRQPLRTQAITTVPPSAALLQRGNVPLFPGR